MSYPFQIGSSVLITRLGFDIMHRQSYKQTLGKIGIIVDIICFTYQVKINKQILSYLPKELKCVNISNKGNIFIK